MTAPVRRKRARRGSGEGSIYRRSEDGIWCGSLFEGEGLAARRRYVYGASRREVADKISAMIRKRSESRPLLDSNMRLDTYLTQWLADVAAPRCRESTMASYENAVYNHLIPALGHIHLDRLTPVDVRRFLLAKRGATGAHGHKLSARSVRYMHSVLRNALNDAMRDELLSRNVAQLVRAPSETESDYIPEYLSAEQAATLLAAARGDRLEAMWRLAITGGLRRGELVALRWDDVQLDAREVWVRRTISRQAGKGVIEGPPKSRNSTRVIRIGEGMAAALRAHRDLQDSERAAMGNRWASSGRVFTSPIGTTLDPRNVVREYEAALVRAGIPRVRFHALRHTCATLMLAEGEPLEVIADRLGHGDIRVTAQVYAHVIDKSRVRAADRLDNLFDQAERLPASGELLLSASVVSSPAQNGAERAP